MKPYPPQCLQFLRWFCREDYLEEIEGDLTEIFKKQCESSPRKAKWKFTWSVIRYFRPEFIKSFKNSYQPHPYGMYKSYFKIGWRNLVRDKGYSLINIGGLAMGMAVAILIGLWVYDELSFDKYHRNYDRIARSRCKSYFQRTRSVPNGPFPYPLSEELHNTYSQDFEYVSMASWSYGHLLENGDMRLSKEGMFVEPAFPEMMTLEMMSGNQNALQDPSSIILSQSLATTLFGDQEDPTR